MNVKCLIAGLACFCLMPDGMVPTASAQARDTVISLSPEQCRQMASQNNYAVKNSSLDVLAARAQKGEALAEYFPKVSITSFGFYSLNPMLEIGIKDILGENDMSNNIQNIINEYALYYGIQPAYSTLKQGFTAAVTVMQPVFAGGRIVNGNKLASLGVEAAVLQKNISVREKMEETDRNYWQIVALEEKRQTLGQLEKMLDTLYRDVSSAVAAGLSTETDLMQVKLKKNELEIGKIQLGNGIRLAKMNLLNIIGAGYTVISGLASETCPYIDDFVLTSGLDDLKAPEYYYVPEEEMAAALDEVKLLDLSVEAKLLEKKMALGEAMPQIGVGASYGYSQLINNSFNANVFAMISIPLSDWGKTAKKARRLDYQLEKAKNERQYYSEQLLLMVRQLWINLTSAWDQMNVARESMELAEKTAEQLTEQYSAGLVPLSELLTAETELRQSSEEYIDRCIDYSVALNAYLTRQQ